MPIRLSEELHDGEAFDVRETYVAQDAALAKVWNDPELDAYQDIAAESQPSS